MLLKRRIETFVQLGEILRDFPSKPENKWMPVLIREANLAEEENPWFTQESISSALVSIGESLREEKIEQWIAPYQHQLQNKEQICNIAVVMAGNIPAVGFHDFLCVLISGNKLSAKLSSQDRRLISAMAEILKGLDPQWGNFIHFSENKISDFQMIIATGTNHTFRHFTYYFKHYPHLFRHNRNAVAVLRGSETSVQLEGLAGDMLKYFGLGCRSVSKLFVPQGYNFTALMAALEPYRTYVEHAKYMNNYRYYKSIFLLNQTPLMDTGFLLFTPSVHLKSNIGVIYYEEYADNQILRKKIMEEKEFIQCIVCTPGIGLNGIPPGQSQKPDLWDYADNIDTMNFILQTNC